MAIGAAPGVLEPKVVPCSSSHGRVCRHPVRVALTAPHGTRCRAAAQEDVPAAIKQATDGPAYPYNAGPGERQQKATIEHIFGKLPTASTSTSTSTGAAGAPWGVGWQMSERNMVWNDNLKLRLIKRIASQELGVSEAELEERLQELQILLPDLANRFSNAPPQWIARLAANTGLIAHRLLRLRSIFPEANMSEMVNGRLSLLLDDDLEQLAQAADALRTLLPDINVDRFAEAFPIVLEVDDFKVALEDAKRLLPNMDVNEMLRQNPSMVMSLMKGKSLIVYDQLKNPFT